MNFLSINRIIYTLVLFGFIFLTIQTYFSQNEMEAAYTQELKAGWSYKLAIIGQIFISIASIFAFFQYNKYFPPFLSFCYIALIVLVTASSIPDIKFLKKSPGLFYSTRGIGTFINLGLLFIAANVKFFKKILNIFWGISIAFIIAGFINLAKVGIGADRQQYLYAILNFAVYLIWVFPFFFLQTYHEKRRNFINMMIFLIVFIFVLATISRAYFLIYVIYILAKFYNQLRSKNGIIIILITIIIGGSILLFLANSGIGKQMDNAFSILTGRVSEDSRSGQIVEFLAQWKKEDFLQGVGPVKPWYWSLVGYYYFLDNQFLFLGWWAGLPVLAIYSFLLLRTLFARSEIKKYKDVKGIRLMIGLWILACLGLAVYINISSELYNYFLSIIMSYHLCKFSKIKNFDPEEV